MADRGLIFDAVLIPGLMNGTVTVASRVMKPQPARSINDWTFDAEAGEVVMYDGWPHNLQESRGRNKRDAGELTPVKLPCPFCPGERCYVKEAWYSWAYSDTPTGYLADEEIPHGQPYRIRSAYTMPRKHARTWFEIISIKPARCQDITVAEARASMGRLLSEALHGMDVIAAYAALWERLNARRGFPWVSNPWVWRLTLKLAHSWRAGEPLDDGQTRLVDQWQELVR